MKEKESENKNYSITLRIRSSVYQKLKEYADHEQLSVNYLANQIFSNFVDWDATASKAGWIVFHRNALRAFLETIDEESLRNIAVSTADYVKDVTLLMLGKSDAESYYTMLKSRAKRSGFVLLESRHGNNKKIIFQHDMGKKWSLFFKIHYERMLYNLGHQVEFNHTDNTLVLDMKESFE